MPRGIGISCISCIWSHRLHPNRARPGDIPVVGSGMLYMLYKPPCGPFPAHLQPCALVLYCSNQFIDLTATSALLLLSGLYGDSCRWDTCSCSIAAFAQIDPISMISEGDT